jgi:hypothetical protein
MLLSIYITSAQAFYFTHERERKRIEGKSKELCNHEKKIRLSASPRSRSLLVSRGYVKW